MKSIKRLAGALGEIRTPDPRIRSPMLYPAELRARDLGSISRLDVTGPAAQEGCPSHRPGAARRCDTVEKRVSETGISSALRAIGRRALHTVVCRWPVIVGESSGHRTGAIIMAVTDRVGQPVPVTMVISVRLCLVGDRGERNQKGRGCGKLQTDHQGLRKETRTS